MTNPYTFTDNPMVSGVSVCNTDIVNDNIMALKWMHDHISFRSIGEIVTSAIPLVDSGLHLLDGANIESGSYANFVSYIADLYNSGDYPDLFTTESNWQSTVTQYGVCGKFVYDSTNNTVRLPKITGKIDGTTDINALGDLAEQYVKLPNITGRIGGYAAFSDAQSPSGAFYQVRNADYGNCSSGYGRAIEYFDASRSSSVYSGNGTDTTIHEQAINVLYYIVIATSTKTDIQVDIDEIATDLNGKADVDLTNVNNSGTSRGASWAMPSDTYDDLTLGSSGTTYIAPANGWVNLVKSASDSQYVTLETFDNNNNTILKTHDVSKGGNQCVVTLPIRKDGIFKVFYNASGAVVIFKFIYAQGSESEAN